MYILGLNIGHNSTACLLKDGKIVGCISEERFSRIKNNFGFPSKSINFLLKSNSINLGSISLIVTTDDAAYPKDMKPYRPSDADKAYMIRNQRGLRRLEGLIGLYQPNLLKKVNSTKGLLKNILKNQMTKTKRDNLVKDLICHYLGNEVRKKIILVNHHKLHALSPCFNLDDRKDWLIITLDGVGGGLSGSIRIYSGHRLKSVSRIDGYDSLGHFYAVITHCLGMRQNEHEFKVMGLAPYAKTKEVNRVYDILKPYFILDEENLNVHLNFIPYPSTSELFRKEFIIERNERFDNIAGGVQKLLEEVILKLVSASIKKTRIGNIAVSGGVFMNVKVNQKICELPNVRDIFIMPSAGDESNAIGACFYGYQIYCEKNHITFEPKPFEDLYLGPEYDDKYIKNLIEKRNLERKYVIEKPNNVNKAIAKLLSEGEIVARCSGKSEFGARALGNRSILANPKDKDTIPILNELIKDRDFWMPFTPSILDKDEKRYIENPKRIKAPYMVLTFNSTKLAREHLPAAMHPYDFTIRPQIVYKDWNLDYYEIISEFKRLTGMGAILNTSFNLHGEPNVLSPEDALHTVENSGLKYLALGSYLLKKK